MKKLFVDMDGTIAMFNSKRNALQRFDKEIGFFAKLKAFSGIEILNELAKNNNIYIISASPNEQADNDKIIWLKKYLPNLSFNNITLCRLGENKAEVIEKKYSISINKDCLLLDDYTKNLNEWESFGGTGIKRLTSLADNSRGLWKGLQIKNIKEILNVI